MSATNLRARVFRLEEMERFQIKRIAGRIIPAIVTTTSLVAGLAALEMYKVRHQCETIEIKAFSSSFPFQLIGNSTMATSQFRNSFLNLALPFLGFSEPVAPKCIGVSAQLSRTSITAAHTFLTTTALFD